MSGISLCGSYIPVFRLDRNVIAEIWQRGSLKGERSVANNDEDSVTMAVEAAMNCLSRYPRHDIDGLYFATTTPVYREKMNSTLIGTAVDLNRNIYTCDFGHSLRSGTSALKAAFDTVESGSAANVLVTTADSRNGYPRSDEEQTFGDGAAAVLVSAKDSVATLEGTFSICNEMMDVWRNPEDTFVRSWEGRFILNEGYINHMKEAVAGILEKYRLAPKDITKAILPAPNLRSHKALFNQLGFEFDTQAQDPLLAKVGHCGTAQPLMMLVDALEEASPGDLLLLAAYADGADAMLFRVTEQIKGAMKQRRLKHYMDDKIMLSSYARFLSYKGLVETVPGEPFRLFPSATVTWRDSRSIYRCHGSRCRKCGVTAFPIQRVCYSCNAKDDFEEVSLATMEGTVFTYTLDNLAGRSDDPVVIQTVAEFGEEKVRFYGMMTDCDPSEVKVGMPVGLTFRRLYEGAGMHNYFWKCRPLRNRRGE
ncbi:MAG: hydroxymethylglutaryl-CoA synthase family protein [Desulfobacteraceae bacterium]